jgi:hypothetical protein
VIVAGDEAHAAQPVGHEVVDAESQNFPYTRIYLSLFLLMRYFEVRSLLHEIAKE